MVPDLSLITTLLLVFLTALIGGLVAKKLNQSTIVGYILGGFFVGVLGVKITDSNAITHIANIGVTLLLFTLGVEFSFHRLRTMLRTITGVTLIQIVVVSLFLYALLILFGFSSMAAIVIAAAGSLSSTAIVLKIFSEKGQLDSVPGEVATGWLVVQDVSVIPMMVLLPALSTLFPSTAGAFTTHIWVFVMSLGKIMAILAVTIILGRSAIPRMLSFVARVGSRELFLLSTVGLVLVAGSTTYALGLSGALGAFIAGLLIAETSQNHAVFAEIRPLRDVFAIVFFVTIGMVIPIKLIIANIPFILGFSVTVMAVKWVIIMGLLRYLGYHRKTAFVVATSLTQMSEFGFILSAEGVRIGALTQTDAAVLASVAFTTILLGTPLLSRGQQLYGRYIHTIGKWVPKFFRSKEEENLGKEQYPIEHHVVLCGYGRVGKYIGRALLMANIPFLVVDYNHATIVSLKEQGIHVVYGDPGDKEVLDFAQVDHARAIVIAIADLHTQELIIGHALTLNKRITIICRTHHEEDQPILKSLGVDTIIQPEFEAAVTITNKLLTQFGVENEEIAGKISRLKIEHGLG